MGLEHGLRKVDKEKYARISRDRRVQKLESSGCCVALDDLKPRATEKVVKHARRVKIIHHRNIDQTGLENAQTS